MVDLEAVDMEEYDELKKMIQKHQEYTQSTVAKFVLDYFDNQIRNFLKVFPKEYKKVLLQKKVGVGPTDIIKR